MTLPSLRVGVAHAMSPIAVAAGRVVVATPKRTNA
jgi:hypothetical protein